MIALDVILAEHGLIKVPLIEDSIHSVDGREIADLLNIKFDGVWADADLLQFTDVDGFISDKPGVRATFYAKDLSTAIHKVVDKMKAFNPDNWKEKIGNWINTIDDTDVKSKVISLF